MSVPLQELAACCAAEVLGDATAVTISAAADIIHAQPGHITLLSDARYAKYLPMCRASACVMAADNPHREQTPPGMVSLLVQDPERAFIAILQRLYPEPHYLSGIAAQAVVADDAVLAEQVHIAPYAVIGSGTRIGTGSVILAGAAIGARVVIGRDCRIHPHAVIYDDCVIGDRVIIHAGAVIGADGFGYKFREGQHLKVPQVGNVILEDDVEIGANTCIDRGALGSTVVGRGSKIDNLVQIGHNNRLGRHVIVCGQSGISGSCTIEDYAILAGSAGIADHVTIGQGAVVLARAGVAHDIPAGAQVFGSPAKEKRIAYQELTALSKLPELLKRVKALEEQLREATRDREA